VLYLTGCVTQTLLNHPRPDVGAMFQPGNRMASGVVPSFIAWAADNGCYSQGDRFDAGEWLAWLASLRAGRATCLFATAPDVVGDATATLARSAPYLPTIRQLGFKAAYVSQDGCTSQMVPWDGIDCLFVGGTDDWKLSEPSYALVAEAKRRGLWAHMGRVNSLMRLRACRVSSLDSADGTFIRFGPDRRLPEVFDWLDRVNGQGVLEATA
jgi:hypothetical protein